MGAGAAIEALFLDVGGVFLSNGWDRHMRLRAADHFGVDQAETDERHHLTFDTYEEGKLSLMEYLHRVYFYQERPFTPEQFRDFMFAQSTAIPEMIELIKAVKQRYALRVAAVSNEGRELTAYRIHKFDVMSFVDFYIGSCFVHFRKPDADIYRIALDTAQVAPERVAYIEDRPMFVEVAETLGIRGIVHKDVDSTRQALAAMGLVL